MNTAFISKTFSKLGFAALFILFCSGICMASVVSQGEFWHSYKNNFYKAEKLSDGIFHNLIEKYNKNPLYLVSVPVCEDECFLSMVIQIVPLPCKIKGKSTSGYIKIVLINEGKMEKYIFESFYPLKFENSYHQTMLRTIEKKQVLNLRSKDGSVILKLAGPVSETNQVFNRHQIDLTAEITFPDKSAAYATIGTIDNLKIEKYAKKVFRTNIETLHKEYKENFKEFNKIIQSKCKEIKGNELFKDILKKELYP